MEKTITLNETHLNLLKEYMKAVTVEEAGMRCAQDAIDRKDNDSFGLACTAVHQASARVDMAARVFSMSVADTVAEIIFGAEQGPRVNPEETAGDAGTPA